jgi:hypothetical protein
MAGANAILAGKAILAANLNSGAKKADFSRPMQGKRQE